MEKFKFAIMGLGNIAKKFTQDINVMKNAKIVSVSSKSFERAKSFAKEFDIDNFYCNYEKMLLNEKIDAVYIATTNNFHFELIKKCLNHKIPVLCEKPMVLNYEEAKIVTDISKKEKIFLMEAMWSRFLPIIQKAKSILEKGTIGKIILSNFDIGFKAPFHNENRYFNPKLGGGASYDITVYGFEILTYLIDQEINKICTSTLYSNTGVDHTNSVSIQFDDCIGNINSTFMVPNFENRLTIYGSKGKIIMSNPHIGSGLTLYPNLPKIYTYDF